MNQKKITLKQGCIIATTVYFAISVIFWLCSYEQLNYRIDSTDMLQNENVIGEITTDTVFSQNFTSDTDTILESITFLMATYTRNNQSHVDFTVLDGDEIIAEQVINASILNDNSEFTVIFDSKPEIIKGKKYTVRITSPDGVAGNAPTIYVGTKYAAGKASVEADLSEEMQTHLNGEALGFSFCWKINTRTTLLWGTIYPFVALAIGALVVIYCIFMVYCDKRGKTCLGLKLVHIFNKYKYLVKQLVTRDFKTKYTRSVLGVMWSFLNPLLMMTVQYVVFSTLFSGSVKNFSLYLLIGIVCFNFFSECAGMCLSSIIDNASLITKVYMPKYIYPVSRALSSCVNLFFSLIPLVGVMLITQSPFSKALVLVPIPLICLFAFSLGIGMILATMMVFFRDTQFLWGVLSTIWMYVTPIIYPESILPQSLMWLFKMNPMYHIVKVVRCIIMDGVSPDPAEYLIIMAMSFFVLLIGALVFKKNQDKFVLNI